jgi:hypothetical protein
MLPPIDPLGTLPGFRHSLRVPEPLPGEGHVPQDSCYVGKGGTVDSLEDRKGALKAGNGLGVKLASIVDKS